MKLSELYLILRVTIGGRLNFADASFSSRHSAVLTQNNKEQSLKRNLAVVHLDRSRGNMEKLGVLFVRRALHLLVVTPWCSNFACHSTCGAPHRRVWEFE